MSELKITLWITLPMLMLVPVKCSVAQTEYISNLSSEYLLGKGVNHIWDEDFGHVIGAKLRKRLARLESATSTIPEISKEIREIRIAIDSKVSREKFERRIKPLIDSIGEIESRVFGLEMQVERLEVATKTPELSGNSIHFKKRAKEFLQQENMRRSRACANVALAIDDTDIDSHFLRIETYLNPSDFQPRNPGMVLACCNDALKKVPDDAVFGLAGLNELGENSKSAIRFLRAVAATEFGEYVLALDDFSFLLSSIKGWPKSRYESMRKRLIGGRGVAAAKLAIRKGGDTRCFNQAIFDLHRGDSGNSETHSKFLAITTISLLEQVRYTPRAGFKMMTEVNSDLDSYFRKEAKNEDLYIRHYLDRFRFLKLQDSGELCDGSNSGDTVSDYIIEFGKTVSEMEKRESIALFTDQERLRAYENIIALHSKLSEVNTEPDSVKEIEKIAKNALKKSKRLRAKDVNCRPNGIPFTPGGVWVLTQVSSLGGSGGLFVWSDSLGCDSMDPNRLVLKISFTSKNDKNPKQLSAIIEWSRYKESFNSPLPKDQPDCLIRSLPFNDMNIRLTLRGKDRTEFMSPWLEKIKDFQLR